GRGLHRHVRSSVPADPHSAARDRAAARHLRAAARTLQAALLQGPEAEGPRQAPAGPGQARTPQFCSGLGRGVSRGGVGLSRRAALRRRFPAGAGDRHRAGALFAGRRARVREPGVRLLPRLPDLLSARAQWSAETVVSFQVSALAVAGAVVLAADGRALHVNYGYAPAPKLERQLADARRTGLTIATA